MIVKELITIPRVELYVEDYEICNGEEVQLFAEGADEVTWSPAIGLTCTQCLDPIASPEYTTTYTITAESCNGEQVFAELTVVVHEIPTIKVQAVAELIKGDSLVLNANVSDSEAIISWNNLTQNICNDCNAISVVPNQNTIYTVTAISSEGCEAQDQIRVNVLDECSEGVMEIPNFLTPNQDGYNDKFVIKYDNYSEVSLLRIYNRWGELVFETNKILLEQWDGTFRGKTLNPDVYVYYIEGYCLNGDPFIKKGNVTIIK